MWSASFAPGVHFETNSDLCATAYCAAGPRSTSRAIASWISYEVYDVLADDKIVGRIMLSAAASTAPWMWSLAYCQDDDRTPTLGYEPTREAALQAFAKSWNRD